MPTSPCGIPSSAQAYSLNLTVVGPTEQLYLTAWPTGQTLPVAATLNAPAAQQLGKVRLYGRNQRIDQRLCLSSDRSGNRCQRIFCTVATGACCQALCLLDERALYIADPHLLCSSCRTAVISCLGVRLGSGSVFATASITACLFSHLLNLRAGCAARVLRAFGRPSQ